MSRGEVVLQATSRTHQARAGCPRLQTKKWSGIGNGEPVDRREREQGSVLSVQQ